MDKTNVICIGLVIGAILFFLIWCEVFNKKETKEIKKQNTPIQYIQQQRDNIKFKVTLIDSLQHEKVIEVQDLNNDSTLQLFYKLIRK